MKYCEKCGKQISDEAIFCERCGYKATVYENAENSKQTNAGEVCENVYTEEKQVLTCEKCGKQIVDGDFFCEDCGAKVADVVKTESSDVKNYVCNKLLLCIMAILSVILIVIVWRVLDRTRFECDGISYKYEYYTEYSECSKPVKGALKIQEINSKNDNLSVNIPDSIDGVIIDAIDCCDSEYVKINSEIILHSNVESITIPEYSTIRIKALSNCENLKTINIPESADILFYEYAFTNCTSLESVPPELLTESRCSSFNYDFSNCTSLKDLDIPYYISILRGGFMNCSSIKSVRFRNGATISNNAFANCTSLETLIIEGDENTHMFGENTFENCSSLEAIIIKSTGKVYFEPEDFKGCTSLKTIYVSKALDMELKLYYELLGIEIGAEIIYIE